MKMCIIYWNINDYEPFTMFEMNYVLPLMEGIVWIEGSVKRLKRNGEESQEEKEKNNKLIFIG